MGDNIVDWILVWASVLFIYTWWGTSVPDTTLNLRFRCFGSCFFFDDTEVVFGYLHIWRHPIHHCFIWVVGQRVYAATSEDDVDVAFLAKYIHSSLYITCRVRWSFLARSVPIR